MQKLLKKISHLITEYIEIKLQYIKLQSVAAAGKIITFLIAFAVLLFLFGLVIFFIAFGCATWINEYLNSLYLGYFITGSLLLIFSGISIWFFSKTRVVQNIIEKQILNKRNRQNSEYSE